MAQKIAQKTANALIPDAKEQFVSNFVRIGGVPVPAGDLFPVLRKALGGLWVGGAVALYDDFIVFAPNNLNIKLHQGDCTVAIPLRDVTDVRVRGGILTKIIDIETPQGKLSVRCFGAKDFAETIRRQVVAHQAG